MLILIQISHSLCKANLMDTLATITEGKKKTNNTLLRLNTWKAIVGIVREVQLHIS